MVVFIICDMYSISVQPESSNRTAINVSVRCRNGFFKAVIGWPNVMWAVLSYPPEDRQLPENSPRSSVRAYYSYYRPEKPARQGNEDGGCRVRRVWPYWLH